MTKVHVVFTVCSRCKALVTVKGRDEHTRFHVKLEGNIEVKYSNWYNMLVEGYL